MKKIHFGTTAHKVAKTALCAALTLSMAVPASVSSLPVSTASKAEVVEAAEDDLPEPLMTITMDQGFMGEKEKNEAVQKKDEGILQFAEVTDDAGNYMKDENGNYIFELNFEKPFIEAGVYKMGTDGNQPTTYWDPQFGSVLSLNSSKVNKKYIKHNSDELDSMHPVYTGGFDETTGEPLGEVDPKSVLQEEIRTYSAMNVKNPFAGMDFTETPTIDEKNGATWTKGVTIGYWVKAAVYDQTEEQEANYLWKNDSILLTFQNDSDEIVYQVDDYSKYLACKEYEAEAAKNGGKITDPKSEFYLGDRSTVTDPATGNTYTIASNYGIKVRMNKDYEGTVNNKVYFINNDKSSGYQVKFTDANGQTQQLFELGYNLYTDYSHFDMDKGSKIKRGRINGSMTIAASNSFAFKEDDYRTEQSYNESGLVVNVPVEGALQENPNDTEKYNTIFQFRHYNALSFQGDGYVLDEDENGQTQWHYVTCVIMNDWVDFYVDGEKMSEDDWMYSASNSMPFSDQCASKYFNKGYGLRAPYNKIGNVSAWSADGTANASPANSVPQTMLEWLSDPETKLMIGGQGSANRGLESQDIRTADGTLLDDITFYDVPFTEEQAAAMYEKVAAEKLGDKAPAKELAKYTFDTDAVGSLGTGITADGSIAPQVVNTSRGHALLISDNKTDTSSGAVLANPFAGMTDLTGATVSYWFKGKPNKKGGISAGIGASFNDDPKILVHEKIQPTAKDLESRTGIWALSTMDAWFQAGYDTEVYNSLKNSYTFTTKKDANINPAKPGYDEESAKLDKEWGERLDSFKDWHFVTMVMNNSGITMYYDGQQLTNNKVDDKTGLPSYYGPRFFDGYYDRVYDGFAAVKKGSNNQGATPLMTFLTQADTKAYIGVAYQLGKATSYQKTYEGLYDNLTYYAGEMTADEVKALYDKEVAENAKPVEGEALQESVWGTGGSVDDGTSQGDDKKEEGFQGGKATANGVTVTAPDGAIEDGVKLVVSILGTTDSADKYTAADSVLAGIANLSVGKRILYDIHLEKDGQVYTPKAAVKVEITPPSGYTAANVSVVYIDGKAVVSAAVSDGKLVFETDKLGVFAIVEAKAGEKPSGNAGNSSTVGGSTKNQASGGSSASGSSKAGKTGDVANVVLPILLLAAAVAAMVAVRRKKVTE